MIKILYAAKPEEFEAYQGYINAGLSELGIENTIVEKSDNPAGIDYIIYAPSSGLQDFTAFTNTKLVQNLWAGVETTVGNKTLTQPFARMVEFGLKQGMIEYVTGHVLRHHLDTDFFAKQKPGVWRDDHVPPLTRDRVVGVLGLGALGQACAESLATLGFQVMGWSRSPKTIENITCLNGESGLKTLLGQAEIIVLLLPNTPATHHIIDAESISMMKEGAAIINPGRGSLINDDALLDALDSGHISAATLDVFATEPLPADHPYWAHSNVLVTPHVASATRIETATQTVIENIRRGEAGEEFLHLVDRDLGY